MGHGVGSTTIVLPAGEFSSMCTRPPPPPPPPSPSFSRNATEGNAISSFIPASPRLFIPLARCFSTLLLCYFTKVAFTFSPPRSPTLFLISFTRAFLLAPLCPLRSSSFVGRGSFIGRWSLLLSYVPLINALLHECAHS